MVIARLWPPARRRERDRRERLWDARWEFWFHCLAARSLRNPEDAEWWGKYRALDAEIKALRLPPGGPDA